MKRRFKKKLERYQLQKEEQLQAAECKHARGMWPVLGWAQVTVVGVETGWEVLGNAAREMASCQNTAQEWSRARILRKLQENKPRAL